jgi:hypothetical protein
MEELAFLRVFTTTSLF